MNIFVYIDINLQVHVYKLYPPQTPKIMSTINQNVL